MGYRTISIEEQHERFLENHPEVNLSALARQAVDQRIAIQQHLDKMTLSGIIDETDDSIRFQALTEDNPATRNGEVPVEIEITPVQIGGSDD